jgi:hypothetical protein
MPVEKFSFQGKISSDLFIYIAHQLVARDSKIYLLTNPANFIIETSKDAQIIHLLLIGI